MRSPNLFATAFFLDMPLSTDLPGLNRRPEQENVTPVMSEQRPAGG